MVPRVILAFGGNNPIIAKAVMDFPEPDSPTTPRDFPFARERLMFSTAIILGLDFPNSIFRFSILSKTNFCIDFKEINSNFAAIFQNQTFT